MIFERNIKIKDELLKIFDTYKEEHTIILSDYPDPDSLLTAVLLKMIIESNELKCQIVYSTPISHQETLAMIHILKIDKYITCIENKEYDFKNIWLVDGHGTENFPLLKKDYKILGVIDHHPQSVEIVSSFIDMFTDAGSAASILLSYIIDIYPDLIKNNKLYNTTHIITGAIYAMRSDTVRGSYLKEFDYKVLSHVSNYLDSTLLNLIENQTYSLETLYSFGEAIKNLELIGSDLLLSNVRIVKSSNRDSIPQSAELLLRTDGINTVIVFGIVVDSKRKPVQISGSLRTMSEKVDVNNYLKEIFGTDPKTLKPYGGGRNYKGGFAMPIDGYFTTFNNEEGLNKLYEVIVLKVKEDVEKFVSTYSK